MHWIQHDELILRDRRCWGRGYGGKPYIKSELKETHGYIKETLQKGGLAGYENRGLIAKHAQFQQTDSGYILPPGFDAETPDRRKAPARLLEPGHPTTLQDPWRVSPELERYYRSRGWELDQHGRPIHPLAMQVLDADIPLCTGFGTGYELGETVVVDSVITDGDNVLLTKRPEEKIPSLVGGYTHGTDYTSLDKWQAGNRPIGLAGIFKGVKRVVQEKAGILLPPHVKYEIVWGIRPWSSYHTLNFWTVTYTVRVRLLPGTSKTIAPTQPAFWMPLDQLEQVYRDGLWPDHRRGLEAALR